ncbi:cytidylate kinase-like family protein [uncultured Prevotella sp.]|uniref:cytidylate kinase-like family protein n=1 Tax=uncultured Prevotella sp. TaxID=159272 RepID=UPI00258F1A6B|nr:cytidylate kinase-like family protein [uncultured Prevotella sp.]
MNRNENFVITINRELGSGGRTIGEILAHKLGVSFYDKALIKALEEKYNLTAEEIEKMKGREIRWWEGFKRVVGVGDGLIDSKSCLTEYEKEPDVLTTENVFKAETEILHEIAKEESCVSVARVATKKNISEDEARKIIEKVDRMRENYVRRYTATSRYETRNYDLVFNSEGKTEEQIANQILMFIE